MDDRQSHKPVSDAYIKQQTALCSRKATISTKLCPQGDTELQTMNQNMQLTHPALIHLQMKIRNELKIHLHLFRIHFTQFEFSTSQKAHQGNLPQSGKSRLCHAETGPFS